MQSVRHSVLETTMNVSSGFIIGWLTTIFLLPVIGVSVTVGQGFITTFLFTSISMVRGLFWRRLFNRYQGVRQC